MKRVVLRWMVLITMLVGVNCQAGVLTGYSEGCYMSVGSGITSVHALNSYVPTDSNFGSATIEQSKTGYIRTKPKRNPFFMASVGRFMENDKWRGEISYYTSMVDYQAGKNKLYLKGDVSQIVNIKHAYQINTNALFISAAYNLWNNEAFSVFGSASVGGAYHNLKLHDSTFTISSVPLSSYKGTVSKTNFAWNVGIGSLINLSEYMKLNLSYQYVDLGSLPTTNLTNQSDSSADVRIRLIENKIRSQNVGLSLLYKF